ncbi:MAG: universal stress protein [Cyclobacteriaceae bacterium]
MRKIVCPVDFSGAANNAVEYAANLSRHYGAQLTLLHIAEDPQVGIKGNPNGRPSTPKEQMQLLIEKMERFKTMVEDDFSIDCLIKVSPFTPTVENALGNQIEQGNYDLVVMGTAGTDELSHFFLGTHTSGLIRKTSTPLLIVPEGCAFQELSEVVYASDYNTEDVIILKELVDLVKDFDSKITVLHVSESDSEASKEIFSSFQDLYKDKLGDEGLLFDRIVHKNVPQGIDEYVRGTDAKLLVLLTRRYSFFKKLFHESTTKSMSFVASYPVLISHGSVNPD